MKLIFLDIDGVLISRESLLEHGSMLKWGTEHRRLLQSLINCDPDIYIVLSSTWRLSLKTRHDVMIFLQSNGLLIKMKNVLGRTPCLDGIRGIEIAEFLRENNLQDELIVILDDDSDMGNLLPCLIKTSMEHGLQQEHIDQILERFDDAKVQN